MKKIYLILLLLLSCNLFSEDNRFYQYGLEGNFAYNYYPASFTKLVGIPNCCPSFNDTYGFNYGFGLVYEYFFSNIGIYSNLSYNYFEGNFLQKEAELFSVNYEPVLGTFNHHLNFDISSLDLELGIKYQLNRLSFGFGLITTLPLSSNFIQYESINVPNKNIFFLDSNGNNTGKNVRNEIKGKIPELTSLIFAPTINFSYDIPLSTRNNIIFKPEVSMAYQINNFVKDLSWKKYQVKLSFNFLFNNNEIVVLEDKIENQIVINQDSILAELEKLRKVENELLLEKSKKDSIDKLNQEMRKLEITRLDSIRQIQLEKEQAIKAERIAFNKMIEDQNRIAGKKCDCYYIEFVSTSNKNEFNKLKNSLKSYYDKEMLESPFLEPYQKIKYYRLTSRCYNDHLEAFDDRAKILNKIDDENFLPKIICK